jgi:Flp pilus assembly protein TadG
MATLTRRRKERQRGLATVEMAISLMLLVLLTFGVLEYGWMFLRIQELTNAARAGARYAVIPDATNAGVGAAVANLMTGAGISGYDVSVSVEDVSTPDTGEPITVTVSVPYANVTLLNMSIFPTPETLSASATMAKETP